MPKNILSLSIAFTPLVRNATGPTEVYWFQNMTSAAAVFSGLQHGLVLLAIVPYPSLGPGESPAWLGQDAASSECFQRLYCVKCTEDCATSS